jgi:hypothetical protein
MNPSTPGGPAEGWEGEGDIPFTLNPAAMH